MEHIFLYKRLILNKNKLIIILTIIIISPFSHSLWSRVNNTFNNIIQKYILIKILNCFKCIIEINILQVNLLEINVFFVEPDHHRRLVI